METREPTSCPNDTDAFKNYRVEMTTITKDLLKLINSTPDGTPAMKYTKHMTIEIVLSLVLLVWCAKTQRTNPKFMEIC